MAVATAQASQMILVLTSSQLRERPISSKRPAHLKELKRPRNYENLPVMFLSGRSKESSLYDLRKYRIPFFPGP